MPLTRDDCEHDEVEYLNPFRSPTADEIVRCTTCGRRVEQTEPGANWSPTETPTTKRTR